jgi:hypothetical protein
LAGDLASVIAAVIDEFLTFLPSTITACALEGEECACDYGNKIWYGTPDSLGNLDKTKNYTQLTSKSSLTRCVNSNF